MMIIEPTPGVILELRKQAQMSRKEIANLLQVDPATVWRWETGVSKMQSCVFEVLCVRLERGGTFVNYDKLKG